jgi:DNA-binding MarR family transcriptional regulator
MANETRLLFDPFWFGTQAHKLARRDGPETSKDAAASIDTTRLEQLVYRAVLDCGAHGCISDDVRRQLAWRKLSYSSVTARYKSLIDKGYIRLAGSKRKGDSGRNQRVMIAACCSAQKKAAPVR